MLSEYVICFDFCLLSLMLRSVKQNVNWLSVSVILTCFDFCLLSLILISVKLNVVTTALSSHFFLIFVVDFFFFFFFLYFAGDNISFSLEFRVWAAPSNWLTPCLFTYSIYLLFIYCWLKNVYYFTKQR